jgi:hypothetical protein
VAPLYTDLGANREASIYTIRREDGVSIERIELGADREGSI